LARTIRRVMKRSCTRRRTASTRTHPRARLRPGSPTAPEDDRLPLLPSGPDGVHGPSLRGTRPSTSGTVVVGERCGPRPGVQLRCSGLRIQGTASSPPSTTGADGMGYRRRGQSTDAGDGGEGGIRTLDGLPRTAFPVPRHRPLGDLSRPTSRGWRRGWDSNPRYGYPHTAFRERHLQPLGHLSSSARECIAPGCARPMRTRSRGGAPPPRGRRRRRRADAPSADRARAG
jgi:hypothetical protein